MERTVSLPEITSSRERAYSAYGLCFRAPVAIDTCPSGRGAPFIVVEERPYNPQWFFDLQQKGAGVTGHFGGRVLFHIPDGRSAVVARAPDVADDELAGFVTNAILAKLLRMRGSVALHASGVVIDGMAVAFAGESGWGKSTMAQVFNRRGHAVLTDDVFAIDLADGAPPTVRIGPSYIKLRPGAGRHFDERYEELPPVTASTQRLKQVEGPSGATMRVRKIYVLDPFRGKTAGIVSLPPSEAVLHLLTHSWGRSLFRGTGEAAYLSRCAALARQVPIARLERARDLTALDELADAIEADLAYTFSDDGALAGAA